MSTKPRNLIILMSDEHDPRHLGLSGCSIVKTPNLDRLAARGLRFADTYTPSPICVPARAAIATGQYVHRIGYWDNALAYDGRIRGWGHQLQDAGVRVESIGKLHYRNAEAPTGFDRQHMPMHLSGGHGMIWASVRDPLPEIDHRNKPRMIGATVGPGESSYTQFDRETTKLTVEWLQAASSGSDAPWVLFVGFVAPHFPLVAPPEFAQLYPSDAVPPFKLRPEDGYQRHPWVQAMDEFWPHDDDFADDEERRRAVAMYYALCSFLDHNIGVVLNALARTGLNESTRVIYTSDHGDNLGSRGMWGKSTLYQEAVAVPLILAGPEVGSGVVTDPVSLLDLYPTVLEATGVTDREPVQRPGVSLLSMGRAAPRTVFSEYHAVGAPSGAFMVRKGRWKYHHYVGFEPELFDLAKDPEEMIDRAKDPDCADILRELERELLTICDPVGVDAAAKRAQAVLIDSFGGREKALALGNIGATPPPATVRR
jgi:choline-sulfatase